MPARRRGSADGDPILRTDKGLEKTGKAGSLLIGKQERGSRERPQRAAKRAAQGSCGFLVLLSACYLTKSFLPGTYRERMLLKKMGRAGLIVLNTGPIASHITNSQSCHSNSQPLSRGGGYRSDTGLSKKRSGTPGMPETEKIASYSALSIYGKMEPKIRFRPLGRAKA